MSDTEKDPNTDDNKNDMEDNLTQLQLKDEHDFGIDIDTVDLSSIPPITELRTKDDLQIPELLEWIDLYQQKIEIYQAKAFKLKESTRENVKKHRGSVIDLHNRMFKKLIDTESVQKTELEVAQDTILELQTEIKKYKLTQQEIEAHNKGDAESFKTGQLQTLVDENATLEKKANALTKRLKDHEGVIEVEKLKHAKTTDSHRKSISTLHTNMFKKLLDAEDDFEDKIDQLHDDLSRTQRELQLEKMKTEQSDKLRRDSIQTVHNNMLTKLLDAQAEGDEKEERYQNQIKELKSALRKEILRSAAKADKDAERRGYKDGDDSDMSDLETEKVTRSNSTPRKEKFDDLWNEADVDVDAPEIERLKAHIDKLESELKLAKDDNEEIERTRKDSIHNLHNNMFQKLLDAEFEYEEEIERLHREKDELNEKIAFYEDAFEKMNNGERNGAGVNPAQVMSLKDEIKAKNDIIEENKQRIFQLTQKIEALEVKVENEQKQRRGSVSFLSKQMMAKLLEAEEENEEQRQQFKQKLQRLQKELEDSKEMSFNQEKARRNSVTKVSQTMFHRLLVAEQTKKQLLQGFEDRIKELERQLAVEKLKNETVSSQQEMVHIDASKYKSKTKQLEQEIVEIKEQTQIEDRQRRVSMSQLQNSYWEKLLDAEDSHTDQVHKLKKEIVKLQQEKTILVSSKLHLIIECDKQMNQLRTAVHIYNKNASSSWF